MVHDEYAESPNLAFMLSRMVNPEFPVPIGVFREVAHPVYEQGVIDQVDQAQQGAGRGQAEGPLQRVGHVDGQDPYERPRRGPQRSSLVRR